AAPPRRGTLPAWRRRGDEGRGRRRTIPIRCVPSRAGARGCSGPWARTDAAGARAGSYVDVLREELADSELLGSGSREMPGLRVPSHRAVVIVLELRERHGD